MRVVTTERVPAADLPSILAPRDTWLRERTGHDGQTGHLELDEGPFETYERRVEVDDHGDGTATVRQEVNARLAIPYWGWLFVLPLRREAGRVLPKAKQPWWLPPDRFDARSSTVLAVLCVASVIAGTSGVLLSQTLTFAADQFGADTGSQGLALAAVRADVLVALGLIALADRRGRRWVVVIGLAGSCILTAMGALAPTLGVLVATQIGARGCQSAVAIGLGIVAAEEMPASSRAYAISLLAMAGALGAAVPILLLFVADLSPNGWRVLFALAILGLPAVRSLAKVLPESRRFGAPHVEAAMAGHGGRFWLLAASGFLFALFFAPAAQFTNEYLREERGFSGGHITLFTVLTNLPGGIGIVVGGRLAERGRRLVGAVGVLGGVGATTLMFIAVGWPLWAWSAVASLLGAATVPALGVYGPELFPTSMRGRSNGIITAVGRVGSVIGLVVCGVLANRYGGLGPALSILALGPLAVAVLIVVAYPETAHRELEDLNPEDLHPEDHNLDGLPPEVSPPTRR